MIDQLPWILALLVAAAAGGYWLGRRRPGTDGEAATTRDGHQGPAEASGPLVGRPGASPSSISPASPTVGVGGKGPGPSARTTREPRTEAPAMPSARHAIPSAAPSLAGVRSWGYQLQQLNLARAAASPFDLLVIDYAKDGSDDTALKPAEIERLKAKPDGARRIVVAYVSIGEAESYRSYWQKGWKRNKPAWLLGENPEWEENYAVCFWEPEWQALFCGRPDAYIDRIIAQGFDGIYLDKCDVTEDLRRHFKAVARSRPGMDDDMTAFVRRISAYAKGKRPGFQVIMQNAEPLLEKPELRAAIDAVAKEELLFGLDRPEKPNSREEVAWSRQRLDLMKREGKPVLMVEYLDQDGRITEAAEAARRLGYILYVAPKDRELDKLRYITPGA